MYQVLNVNWSAFLKGILLTLQGPKCNNGTNVGGPLGSGDLHRFDLSDSVVHWCVIGHCVGIVAAQGVSQMGFLPPPTPPHFASQHTHHFY